MVDEQLPVVQTETFLPVEMSVMADRLAYVEKFCKEVLKEGTDYGVIPGTNKPTMYKPGSEKLAFAFCLEARYSIVSKIEEPFREWDYEITDRRSGNITKNSVRGYFKFTILCELFNRTTGERWGSQLADCDSLERGRETSPSNTIMKMAEKRAYVGAILNATFTSDRFTQDVEDYKGNQAPSGGSNGGSGNDGGFPSKYGSKAKPSFCAFCETNHVIIGDLITTTGKETKAGKKSYGAVACRDKKEPEKTEERSREESIKNSESDTTGLIVTIQKLESMSGVTDKERDANRIKYMGVDVLNEANHHRNRNYLEALENAGAGEKL